MLQAHFVTGTNLVYERHNFRGMTFKAGETCDQSVVRLCRQARLCEFNDDAQMSEAVRDQLRCCNHGQRSTHASAENAEADTQEGVRRVPPVGDHENAVFQDGGHS